MILYHKGDELAGPCFTVNLMTGFVVGFQWLRADGICMMSRLVGLWMGPLLLQFWWPATAKGGVK